MNCRGYINYVFEELSTVEVRVARAPVSCLTAHVLGIFHRYDVDESV